MKLRERIDRFFMPIQVGDYIRFRNGRYSYKKGYEPRFDIGEILKIEKFGNSTKDWFTVTIKRIDKEKIQDVIISYHDVEIISSEKMMLWKLENL